METTSNEVLLWRLNEQDSVLNHIREQLDRNTQDDLATVERQHELEVSSLTIQHGAEIENLKAQHALEVRVLKMIIAGLGTTIGILIAYVVIPILMHTLGIQVEHYGR